MTNGLSLEELMKEGTYPEEYAEGENWRILHGDTLKLVKAFQPGIFDAVITDPPYASGGTKQNERNRTTNQKYSSMSAANALPDFDGDNKDQRSWTHWMAEWLYDVRKACKKGAPICLFIDWRQYPSITDALQWAGWIWRGTAVWDKGNSRPQKGRYREFYQCDADVVGSNSLLNEVELMQIVDTVFSRFGIRVCIKINNRKILSGIAEIIGEADKIVDITVAIDKLDKIGLDNVNAELKEKGISDEAIAKLQPIILLSGTNAEKLATLKNVLSASEVGLKGVEESEFILNTLETMGLKNEIELDLTLARGLNYYTGAIFEVKALDVQIGSISGGGRYDNLTGVFGMDGMSGVGISFGADRIFDVLNQLDLYPKEAVNGTELLFVNFGDKEAAYCLPILAKVRETGVRAEIYPDAAKMKKQMGYANDKQIPFVAIVGENEMNEGKLTLKNMTTGEQSLVTPDELLAVVKA